jgi:lipopolysaccharide export system permease protein
VAGEKQTTTRLSSLTAPTTGLDQIARLACNPGPFPAPALCPSVTTYDRHLLARYFHVFVVFFVAAMGLFVVMDGFTNLDGFQSKAAEGGDGGTAALLALMARHYLYHSSLVLDLVGPTLAVMSIMCVMALVLKHGELHPLLAAGVPLYRLSRPFLVGLFTVNGLLAANQEWIIPRIAQHLQGTHGETGGDALPVEPTFDTRWYIHISGRELIPATGAIREAEFHLPPELAEGAAMLCAREARFQRETSRGPAGWLLSGVEPRFDALRLTESGRQVVLAGPQPDDVFVRSELTFDQLCNRGTSHRYLSTPELIRRIRRPNAGLGTRRAQIVHLHSRLTRPLLTLIGLFLVLPLIAPKDRFSIVTSVAVCMTATGSVYAIAQGMLLVGNTGLMSTELCAWAPLIGGGALCAWLVPVGRT